MKRIFTLLVLITNYSFAQNINEINYLYSSAVQNWNSSSKTALPFFEKLYYQIEPLYNKYYTNNIVLNDEIHKMSRNYIRFMNEYYLKGLGGKEYIAKAWQMSQTIKSFEALKEYNTLRLLKSNSEVILDSINKENTFDFESLRKLNAYVETKTNNSLFLESPAIQEIQEKLKNDDVYLSFNFSLNDRSFYIISITKKSYDVYKSKITTYELFNRIVLIKGIIEKNDKLISNSKINLEAKGYKFTDDINNNLNAIGKEINQVLQKYIVNKIIVENDIIISQIPFDLLKTNNNVSFYNQYQITYVPNASYYTKLFNKNIQYSQNIIGISPKIQNKDNEIEEEVQIIKDIITDAKTYTNCSSTAFLNLLKDSKSYDIMHLSSHFNKDISTSEIEKVQINGKDYLLNQLSIKDGYFSFEDKKISIKDIFSQNEIKVKTLILSGCETATSDDILSITNPLIFSNVENENNKINLNSTFLINQGCYCNNTKSFDNLILTAMPFYSQYIIAFQNSISQEYSWKFFNEFYLNYKLLNDTKSAFFTTKKSLMNLNDSGYYDYSSIILISK